MEQGFGLEAMWLFKKQILDVLSAGLNEAMLGLSQASIYDLI